MSACDKRSDRRIYHIQRNVLTRCKNV